MTKTTATKQDNGAKMGDLKALVLLGEGIGIAGAGTILGQTMHNTRYRLQRLERATGKRLYTRHVGKPPLKRAMLTDEGRALAAKARKMLEIWEAAEPRPCRFHDYDTKACETYSGQAPCEAEVK